jgi:hypothetical protein
VVVFEDCIEELKDELLIFTGEEFDLLELGPALRLRARI